MILDIRNERISLPFHLLIFQVCEAIPLKDASVDAVIGTLVLCSVGDVDQALKGKSLTESIPVDSTPFQTRLVQWTMNGLKPISPL